MNKDVEDFLVKQLMNRFVSNEEFLKDVEFMFKDYTSNLNLQSIECKQSSFSTHLINTSRGYILKLMVMKYLYKEMLENIDYFVDQCLIGKLEDYFFDLNNGSLK